MTRARGKNYNHANAWHAFSSGYGKFPVSSNWREKLKVVQKLV